MITWLPGTYMFISLSLFRKQEYDSLIRGVGRAARVRNTSFQDNWRRLAAVQCAASVTRDMRTAAKKQGCLKLCRDDMYIKLLWRLNHLRLSNSKGTFVRDCFVNAPSQWKMTLQCNVISHWLGAYAKWSLIYALFWKYIAAVKSHSYLAGDKTAVTLAKS